MRRLDKSGVASMITALCCMALVGAAAIGVDLGAVYLKSRQLQGLADIAAMSAAEDLPRAQARAEAVVAANSWGSDVRVVTELGHYEPDPALASGQRFAPGAGGANAVRVRLRGSAPLYFAAVFMPRGGVDVARAATAAQTQLASFQIGSRLLALRGGVANAVLSGLTGSSVSLSVMDYDALLSADVNLFSYLDALRTELNLRAASYDQVLQHQMNAPQALDALAAALNATGESRAAAAMARLADAARRDAFSGLDDLIDLGPYGAQDVVTGAGQARVEMKAMDIATAVLELANGERQVAMNLGAAVPGLSNVRAWLAIGERPNASPWLAVTSDHNIIIRTAQMRLYLEANVAVAGVAGLASLRVPLLVEAASAQAHLEAISCTGGQRRVTLAVSPSVGQVALADIDRAKLNDFRHALTLSRARLATLPLITITGLAHADLGGAQWQNVAFTGADIDNGVVKTVQTRDIAQATVASLVSDLDLDVRVAGLGLSVAPVTRAVGTALGAATPALDGLVNGLSDLVGLHLGEADVRMNGVRCAGAALVG